MTRMHADQAAIDAGLVRRLLRGQFPRWGDLPVREIASGGTVNAIYRVGDELSARLPLTSSGSRAIGPETEVLRALGPLLPVPVPVVAGIGEPAEGYPHAWAVHRWIDGEPPVEDALRRPETLARELGAFVRAVGEVTLDGPASYRGGPLADVDAETREAIDALAGTDEPFDPDAARAAWEAALAAPGWDGAPRWTHSDLMPSNLLVSGGRLAAVLDLSTAGLGDPACDLIPAWNLFTEAERPTFREATNADSATWARGRGWALSMALIQLPYYRHTNRIIAANARRTLRQVLADRG